MTAHLCQALRTSDEGADCGSAGCSTPPSGGSSKTDREVPLLHVRQDPSREEVAALLHQGCAGDRGAGAAPTLQRVLRAKSGTSLFGVRTGLASSLTRAAYRMRSHCFSVIEEPTSRAKRYVRSWLPITRQPT